MQRMHLNEPQITRIVNTHAHTHTQRVPTVNKHSNLLKFIREFIIKTETEAEKLFVCVGKVNGTNAVDPMRYAINIINVYSIYGN